MAIDGWFPRASHDGRHVVRGSVRVSFDGDEIADGAAPQFAGATVYYTKQPTGEFMRWVQGLGHQVVRAQGFNFFDCADDGRWVGYRADPPRLIWHDGVEWPGWADGDLSTTRWAARVQATGALHAGTGNGQGGKLIDARATTDVRIEGDVLVWRVGGRIYAQRGVDMSVEDWSIEGASHLWPVPVSVGGHQYVLTHTQDNRLLLYEGREHQTQGFVLALGVTDFPDARAINATTVRVVWSERGEPREAMLDVTRQTVNLTAPTQPIEDTTGLPFDVFEFMVPQPGMFPRTSGISTHGHEMHCIFDGRNFYTLPFGELGHWVRSVLESGTLTFREDHSKDGQSTGDYSFTHGIWARQIMRVGDQIVNAQNNLVRYAATGCEVVDVHAFPFTTGVFKKWITFDCGGHLGWQEVIAYLYDPGGTQDIYELSYYAKGYGFFRWEEYEQRTGVLRHWTTFNEFGGRAPQPTDGCWKREHLDLTPENWNQPKPEPKPDPKPETRTMMSFKTSDGVHLLCAEGGGGREINATRTEAGPWETFEIVKVDGGVALKASNGQFVCAELGGGGALNANRDAVGAWETFTLVPIGNGVALRSIDGHFVCAELGGGGEVNVTRTEAGAWETFVPSVPLGGSTSGGGIGGTRDFIGPIRVDPRGGFMKPDGTPVLVQGVHDGAGFSRFCYDPEGQALIDDISAQAGFHFRRSWFSLGGPFWKGHGGGSGWPTGRDRSVGPWRYPDFKDRLVAWLRSGLQRGLGAHIAGGDFTRETIPDWRVLADLVRQAIEEVGPDAIVFAEVLNECLNTGDPSIATMQEFARRAYSFPGMLVGMSALGGFDVEAQIVNGEQLRRYNPSPANVIPFHGFRDFGWLNKLERDWNTRYEWGIRWAISGEPVGVGRRVSATRNMHELNGAFFQIRSALMLACGYIDVHMSGPGVISDEGFEPYGLTPGFFEVCKVRDWLPANAGHYTDVFHGGDNRSFSPRRVYRAIGDTRVEHFLHPETGQFIVIAYGNESAHLPQNRGHRVDNDVWIEEGHIKGRVIVGQA